MMKTLSIPTILATTFFAVMLWLSVSLSDQYQIHVAVPVRLSDVPTGKAIAAPLPREVKLTFNDYGWRLAKMLWGKNPEWRIDLARLWPRRQVLTLRDVAEQLGPELGVSPIAIYPESIYIALDHEASKRIAIVPDVVATFREGYGQIGPIVVVPESVTVVGAAGVVRTLAGWRTQQWMFEQLRDPVNMEVPLADTTVPLRFEPASVRLFVEVQQLAEKTFEDLPIEPIAVPPNREVLLRPPRITVVVRGGIEQLGRMVPADVRVSVNYRLMVADTSGLIEPAVALPPGVRLLKKIPDRLQFVIRKKNMPQASRRVPLSP